MPVFLERNAQALVGISAFSWAATYIALLILMLVVLALLVIRQRYGKRIGIGDGDDPELLLAMRAHGNFVENVPFGLAALVMLPMLGANAASVHGVGATLVLGRLLHAIGLSRSSGASIGRGSGMLLTWLSLLLAAGFLLRLAWK
jgi:uncharacterized membrane protein YecN with MAPEG domain